MAAIMKAFFAVFLAVVGLASAQNYDAFCTAPGAYATAHPKTCGQFLYCNGNVATVLNCPPGKMFDDIKNICLPQDVAHCAHIPTEDIPEYILQICSSMEVGQTIPAEACDKYYVCYGTKAFELTCPNGQHYSRAYTSCMNPLKAGCRALNTMCVGQYPGFTFPSLICEQYFVCNEILMPELNSCDTGLYFSVNQKNCTSPETSGCVNESSGTTTPEPGCSTEPGCGCGGTPAPPPSCAGLENGSFLPNAQCNMYYMCFNSTATEFTCDCGQFFNKDLKQCVVDTNKVCLKD